MIQLHGVHRAIIMLRGLVITTLLLGLLGPLGAATASAQIYRWVDAQGSVNFTDSPPIDAGATRVDVRVPAVSPTDDPANQRLEDIMNLTERQDRARLATREAAPENHSNRISSVRKDNADCHQARVDYYWLSQDLAVYADTLGQFRARYRADPYQGERTWLTDADRQSTLKKTIRKMARFCEDPSDQAALNRVSHEVQLAEACTIDRARLDAMLDKRSRTAEQHIHHQEAVVRRVCQAPV